MRHGKGFGFLDLMITLVVASLLMTLSVPAYNEYAQRARVSAATSDIAKISLKLEQYRLENENRLPASLAELNMAIPDDPWGRPYVYLNILAAGPGFGGMRKDGKLNPLNTDFDLYSRGRDGESQGALSAAASRDDIVRANNGSFIGLGEDY